MDPGEIVGDRFVIERRAGSGGMGTVYQAHDRLGGETVALKVLHAVTSEARGRFLREAKVLAELRHPGVVRYVAHGTTALGHRYIAMEWLEGEDLLGRVRRTEMSLDECVRLARRAAEALGAAHSKGIVHRDIKPSNLFLPTGDVDRVKVLDFGIARLRLQAATMLTMPDSGAGTSTGTVLGTLGYFAPEQARGSRDVGPRADVFSLGCVLFRCVAGRPPFLAEDPSAVLAKILFEDSPRLSELRSDVPAKLDRLVARMLMKDPADRPADGSQVAEELASLGDVGPRTSRPSASLTTGERRLVSVVVAAADPTDPALSEDAPTEVATSSEGASTWEGRRANLVRFGARLERLADGMLVATVTGQGDATSQVAQAGRCALAMREQWTGVPMGMATGRGVIIGKLPVGEVIDRAVQMVRMAQKLEARSNVVIVGPWPIRMDEVTAGLLDSRFEVGGGPGGLELLGEREPVETVRTLLGRPTPCVGREAEIAVLSRIWEECADEPMAHAALVTGPAGAGKSRLRHELVEAVRARGPAEVWIGRGDSLSAGSPFGTLAQALRRAAGVTLGESVIVRQQRLRARIARHVRPDDVKRVTEFLGELIGAPFDDEERVQLRAARQDPVLMGDQMRRAWEDFLAAECAAGPVLLVLEDLQWGDLPTVKFVDAAMRNLAERPFMVLALARPEVHDAFPSLWAQRRVQEVRLGPLTRRASERLVRAILGDDVEPDRARLLADRAAGNAFYLEELIRAAAEGKEDALPETVLAMVQARLESLDPDARLVLRAASIFGDVFWRGGLMALLGWSQRSDELEAWLSFLVERELVGRRDQGRFPGEPEYGFRHSLVREAAHAMLTDADRTLGHRLAAEWLEKAGEREALVLAEHFERGREPARAVGWYERAAEKALGGNDLEAVLARAEEGVRGGAGGEALGRLRLLQAEAHRWRGENAAARRASTEAMDLLPIGSARWYAAAGEVAEASGKLGDNATLEALCDELVAISRAGSVSGPQAIALARTARHLLYAGGYERVGVLFDRMAELEGPVVDRDPAVAGWIHRVRATRAMFVGDQGAYMTSSETAVACFEAAGDLRNACRQRSSVGFASIELGRYAQAELALRDALAAAERMGLQDAAATAMQNLGLARARQGALEEARWVEAEALDAFVAQGDLRMEGGSRAYLALILLLAGELEAAEAEAKRAAEVLMTSPPGRAYALAILTRVRLARGVASEALEVAEEASALLASLGAVEEGESFIRLVHAEALYARGRITEAQDAIEVARDRLLDRAARIADPALRQSFLDLVPESARTLELALAWDA